MLLKRLLLQSQNGHRGNHASVCHSDRTLNKTERQKCRLESKPQTNICCMKKGYKTPGDFSLKRFFLNNRNKTGLRLKAG